MSAGRSYNLGSYLPRQFSNMINFLSPPFAAALVKATGIKLSRQVVLDHN